MARQNSTPILLAKSDSRAIPLQALSRIDGNGYFNEAELQILIHENPEILPIVEVDPLFAGAISICRELVTAAGQIDNFLVTPTGLPVIVETKLWRNPEGRRKVVGQILDYAKELTKWSCADLHREVRKRIGGHGNPMLDIVRASRPDVDEIEFNDALTFNLRRGRFLLLIVGDGIREGVEAIAEYVQRHAGLHFSLGLIELPIYQLPDGSRLVLPRILAQTAIITRHVVAHPVGFAVQEVDDETRTDEQDPERVALQDSQQRFWAEFLSFVKLDDPEQVIPKPARIGYLTFMLPAPGGSSWLTVYRDAKKGELGVILASQRNGAGEHAARVVASDWVDVVGQLGGTARLEEKDGRPRIIDSKAVDLSQPASRSDGLRWLAERVNTFVNVLRPRVRSAAADYEANS